MSEVSVAHHGTNTLLDLLRREFSTERMFDTLGQNCLRLDDRLWDAALHAPLREFLSCPGKEFRARFVETSFELAGGKGSCPAKLLHLVEILHAGSLIIDDIEDDSSLRRGQPALHRLFGVPVALNAGNWLYFWACSLVEEIDLGPHAELSMHRWLHSTLLRCHYGQALDLKLRVSALKQSQVHTVVSTATRLKTGCLMELAAALGAIAAGANREVVQSLAAFGSALGVGLQMLDDYGGLTSQERRLKGYEDLLLGRPTWPWAWLSERLVTGRFAELQSLAQRVERKELGPRPLANALLDELGVDGPGFAKRQLREALDELKARVNNQNALLNLSAELWRLEQSYG